MKLRPARHRRRTYRRRNDPAKNARPTVPGVLNRVSQEKRCTQAVDAINVGTVTRRTLMRVSKCERLWSMAAKSKFCCQQPESLRLIVGFVAVEVEIKA
jgi:hypothetical protein